MTTEATSGLHVARQKGSDGDGSHDRRVGDPKIARVINGVVYQPHIPDSRYITRQQIAATVCFPEPT